MCVCVYVCVCVCVCVRECVRACVSVCVRRFFFFFFFFLVCVYQSVAPPCTDQKRSPNSRLLLNLIPGHHFTMFSTALYDDIRTKEASQKRICEFFVPIEHLSRLLVCWFSERYRKGFLRG